MSAELVTHDLRRRRTTVATVAVALGGLTVFLLSVGAGLGDTMTQLTEQMPAELTAFIGGDGPGGYVVSELMAVIAPAFLVAFAVLGGANASAGEEGRGTMSLLSAQPVTRTGVLAAKTASLLLGLAFVTAALLGGLLVGATLFDIGLDVAGVAAASLHLLALATFFGAVSCAVGAATGRPGLAAAVGGGLAVVSYLADSLLPLAGLDGWARLSPWFYYAGSEPLANGADPAHLLLLLALAGAAALVAFLTYPRRDLKG